MINMHLSADEMDESHIFKKKKKNHGHDLHQNQKKNAFPSTVTIFS